MEKRTPLYGCHLAAGGKMVPFGGYSLPVYYQAGGALKEHLAVRNAAGLFDVSHMGEIFCEGPDALANLQKILTNDFQQMAVGKVRYSLMCNEQGGIVDDLLVYKLGKEKYLLVVNAANREKDLAWLERHLFGAAVLTDRSEEIAQIALQGPAAAAVIAELTPAEQIPQNYYSFVEEAQVGHSRCLLSRTGYTGSFGYELYTAATDAKELWQTLLAAGSKFGVIPCGLGARDTLRLEAGMPLYGHEMDDRISPFETGLSFAVKMAKPDFIGKAALLGREEPELMRIGLAMTGRQIAREPAEVFAADGEKIGQVTSGTYCPYLGKGLAMALVNQAYIKADTQLTVQIRNKRIAAELVPLPFYQA